MCGNGAGKQHMLCWHPSLASELWLTETTITQTVIKHSPKATWRGQLSLPRRSEVSEGGKHQRWNNCGKTERTTQSYQAKAGNEETEWVLPPCCNTVNRPIGSTETTTRCGDITQTGGLSWMGAGGCWGLICGRVGDILSLLIIVWILCILNNTFSWHRQYELVMWLWRWVEERVQM